MQRNDDGLSEYYAARAPEYERIYSKLERQADLHELKQRLPEPLAGKRVIEVACGTGYWTQHLAGSARQIVATDINPETLALAGAKGLSPARVDFRLADAYELADSLGTFDGAFVGFWWSHIPRQAIDRFLASLHRRLEPGATVVLVDNLYVEGSSTPVARTDEYGNTFQHRSLDNGSTHEVLKNFPTKSELSEALADVAKEVSYTALTYYWYVRYISAT